MKSILLLIGLLAVANSQSIEIDWSQVRPIEEFDHYWARLPAEVQFLRNATPERRITNGQEATPGQFPYQITLLSTFIGGTGLCGGSVLSVKYVLTAAHCAQNALGGFVIVGAHNISDTEPTKQVIAFNQTGIHVHAGYDPNAARNDIATIRLNSPITFNTRVRPVRMPTLSDHRSFAGVTGTVSGFGRTSDASTDISVVIKYTTNPIMYNADCLARWGNNPSIIQQQNICLSGDGGRSSCNGDSGGPLTVQDSGSSLQVGIVSFGSRAGCTIGMPSVYVRVTEFLPWIQQNSDFVPSP